VSINLSAENLGERGFIDRITDLVATYEVPPSSVTWEVTETTVMNNLSSCLANLARLRLKGFGLAMDDYGIGYSSMQQLSRCPFTELKIDRAFVDGAAERPNRRAILETSIDMGVKLAVTTVGEGVESLSDWHLLRDLTCDLAQGFLIAKPMHADELPPWINANRARLASLAS
jgi:EAL domain-containing protein (putative c-di-GMP-specific phosphodiesterase class I)